jgi:hypothetical protein
MKKLYFRIETEAKLLPVRDAARFLVCLTTMEDGLRIAEYGISDWLAEWLSGRGRELLVGKSGYSLTDYVNKLGDDLLSGKPIDTDEEQVTSAIKLIDWCYQNSVDNGAVAEENRGPQLLRLSTGSIEGVIEDIYQDIVAWLGGLLSSAWYRGNDGGRFYEDARAVVRAGHGERVPAGGFLVIAGDNLRLTLDSLRAIRLEVRLH